MTTRILILAGLLVPALAFAQPGFTGAWVRDGAQSDIVPNTMYWLTRGVDAGGARGRTTEVTIEIQHSAGQMHINDPARPRRTLVLDGQPHTSPTDTGMQTATATARLQGDSVTVTTIQPFGGMPGNSTLTVTETWTLSADGKQLTIVTERELPARRQSFREVYNRR